MGQTYRLGDWDKDCGKAKHSSPRDRIKKGLPSGRQLRYNISTLLAARMTVKSVPTAADSTDGVRRSGGA